MSLNPTAEISGAVLAGGITARIRLDCKGTGKAGRLFFGGKPVERAAEEAREQQAAVLRNVPIQGITIEDIDMSGEVYTVYDEVNNAEVAYAPIILKVVADTVEDLIRFVGREDFRKIEIISPSQVVLSRHELERVMFRMAEEFKHYRQYLERKLTR